MPWRRRWIGIFPRRIEILAKGSTCPVSTAAIASVAAARKFTSGRCSSSGNHTCQKCDRPFKWFVTIRKSCSVLNWIWTLALTHMGDHQPWRALIFGNRDWDEEKAWNASGSLKSIRNWNYPQTLLAMQATETGTRAAVNLVKLYPMACTLLIQRFWKCVQHRFVIRKSRLNLKIHCSLCQAWLAFVRNSGNIRYDARGLLTL